MDKKDIKAAFEKALERANTYRSPIAARRSLWLKIKGEKLTDNRPVTERVKTFEDACKELGDKHPMWIAYNDAYRLDVDENAHDIIAYLKLRIIIAALNEGWTPQFTEGEERWYPWFTLWTEEELSEKSDEWKADRHLISTGGYSGDYAGFAFSNSIYAPSHSNTFVGSRLCFKSEALATYCGKQFISLWADFNLIHK